MKRGRKASSKTPFTQGNSNTDRESAVHRNSKYRRRQAYFTIDTNPTRKMVYQSTAGLVMVCMIGTSSISQSWNIVGSAQVCQYTSFFWGEDGQAEARESTALEWIPSTPNIVEENVSYRNTILVIVDQGGFITQPK